MYVQVLIEIKAENLDKTFTYHVPQAFKQQVAVGKRVLVPFGKQSLEGFILKIEFLLEVDYPVKDLLMVLDEQPVLNEELLELGQYLKKKTLCNLISAYATMLPVALKAKHGTTVAKKMVSVTSLALPYEQAITFCANEVQRRIVGILESGEILRSELTKLSASAVQTLEKKGLIQSEKREKYRLASHLGEEVEERTLTTSQKEVLKEIESGHGFQPYLLHGVTGSGKTEVYVKLIEKTLQEGKEALFLVPEISLTPQVVETFGKKFGNSIAILHSGLSDGEKYDEWRRIERKEVSIAIGARSAIFAPFTNLGIIIIDEEHSTTYKQENNPRYSTIDVALWRAKRYQIPLVLGSATPSIESYTRARMGLYHLLEMQERVNHNLPEVTLVDMRGEYRKGKRILSVLLEEKMEERLHLGEQVILLLNRRGYSTILSCKNCGFTHQCPNCEIPLTYHKQSHTMSCHYCGYKTPRLMACPKCGDHPLVDLGMGTERLEQYLLERFPTARLLRMDNDTTSRKGSHAKMIESFSKGEYNILVGTQMIAKGLDFPNVTLVGVVNGDSTLNIPDFRSAERTFQLLTQVAGRAGRGTKKGEVIIQGFNIDHYSILAAKNHDYATFYQQEMEIRKKLRYSPYSNLTMLRLKGKNDTMLMEEGTKIVTHFRQVAPITASILGPSFALIPKINLIYEVQVIVKSKKQDWVRKECTFLKECYRKKSGVTLDVDFDPIRM